MTAGAKKRNQQLKRNKQPPKSKSLFFFLQLYFIANRRKNNLVWDQESNPYKCDEEMNGIEKERDKFSIEEKRRRSRTFDSDIVSISLFVWENPIQTERKRGIRQDGNQTSADKSSLLREGVHVRGLCVWVRAIYI